MWVAVVEAIVIRVLFAFRSLVCSTITGCTLAAPRLFVLLGLGNQTGIERALTPSERGIIAREVGDRRVAATLS